MKFQSISLTLTKLALLAKGTEKIFIILTQYTIPIHYFYYRN